MLRLPVDESGRRRAEARQAWLSQADAPIEDLGIFAD
jgi:hypothetical protein